MRWVRLLLVVLAVAAAVAPLPPTPAAAGAPGEIGFIAINARGTAPNTSTDPTLMVFTVDLFSLVSGERVGTLTDEITCSATTPPPCLVFDIVTTYRLPGGDIVNHGRWSGVADPQRPGFALAGTRPERETIVAGTGRFVGRAGRVNGWGTVDASRLPVELGYDMFTVINLTPGERRVVGSSPLPTGPASEEFRAQHFTSDGTNASPDPLHVVMTADLFSLGTGARSGSAVDDVTCSSGPPPCAVLDVLTDFHFRDGDVTARSKVSVVPDPQRPGFGLIGARPQGSTILSGTGAFVGRTGRLLISGSVDLPNVPAEVPYEGISVLAFD